MLNTDKKKSIEANFLDKIIDCEEEGLFFKEHFQYIGVLGEGAFGIVVEARWLKKDGRPVAVKCISKEHFKDNVIEQFRKEAKIAHQLSFEGLLKGMGLIENSRRMYIVLALMKGGTLAQTMKDRFNREEYFLEDEVRMIIRQLILTVDYLHDQKTVHRDLKPENIMLSHEGDLASLKISDLGLAVRAGLGSSMFFSVKVGTPLYMAPEMFIEGNYNKTVDMWSIGVIMYRLLSKGVFPFNTQELKELASKPEKDIEEKFKEISISKNGIHLLKKLMLPDDTKRMPSFIARNHPFLTGEDREPDLMLYEQEAAFSATKDVRKVLQFAVILRHIWGNSACVKRSPAPASFTVGTPSSKMTPGLKSEKSASKFRISGAVTRDVRARRLNLNSGDTQNNNSSGKKKFSTVHSKDGSMASFNFETNKANKSRRTIYSGKSDGPGDEQIPSDAMKFTPNQLRDRRPRMTSGNNFKVASDTLTPVISKQPVYEVANHNQTVGSFQRTALSCARRAQKESRPPLPAPKVKQFKLGSYRVSNSTRTPGK